METKSYLFENIEHFQKHEFPHRTPLYQIIVALSLRAAEILQNIFMSISANVYAQFKHVFRQPGALEPIQKM